METVEVDSCVRGHHIYNRIWTPTLGEELQCVTEDSNDKDPYAVAVMKRDDIVGHVPRRISAACSLFLRRGGMIDCIITASRRFSADLPQGGLEVPCTLKFKGEPKDVKKVIKLFTLSHEKQQPEVSQPTKKRKLDVINVDELNIPDSSSPIPWLTCDDIELTMVDRRSITSGDLLSDKHIDFAQALLRKRHKELTGLNSTLLLAKHRNLARPPPSLQILHTRGNHWIIATTLGYPIGSPKVFDSLYESIELPTLNLLSSLYGSVVKIEDGPKQLGVKDCGVYAIATATLLASGENPGSVTYNQQAMREHLLKCFETFQLTPFPHN